MLGVVGRDLVPTERWGVKEQNALYFLLFYFFLKSFISNKASVLLLPGIFPWEEVASWTWSQASLEKRWGLLVFSALCWFILALGGGKG